MALKSTLYRAFISFFRITDKNDIHVNGADKYAVPRYSYYSLLLMVKANRAVIDVTLLKQLGDSFIRGNIEGCDSN